MNHINIETAIALRMRANYIETGDIALSKHDVADQLDRYARKGLETGKSKILESKLIRSATLSPDQARLVEALREHACIVELQ